MWVAPENPGGFAGRCLARNLQSTRGMMSARGVWFRKAGYVPPAGATTLPRPAPLPRFPSYASFEDVDDASPTTWMPTRLDPRQMATVRPEPVAPPSPRLPTVLYGLSAGVLLGAVLAFAGVSLASPPQADATLAVAGPGAKPAASHRRVPAVRAEDLPGVVVRAEDLPVVASPGAAARRVTARRAGR